MNTTRAGRRVLLGLTGGLASGKSTVAARLRQSGATVYDADRIVRDLYLPGAPGARAVADLFGADHLDADGAVDARKVAARVFADDTARARLEHAVHPLVRVAFLELARASTHDVVALEATRLVEAGFAPDFDLVATVEASREIQFARAVARGHSAADAEARLTAQGDGAPRRHAAHRILRNDGGLGDLEAVADALYREAEARSQGAASTLEPFVLVTGNPGKLAEARRLTRDSWASTAFEGAFEGAFESVALDLPEIQSLDLEEVLTAKADEAFRRLGRAVVVEETGLALAGLNGFPGPLVRWMLEAIGAEGVAELAGASGDPAALATCALLYRSAACSILAVGSTAGRLVLPPRGERGFGWDPVFEEPASAQTYGELADAEKDRLGHRGKAWRSFAAKWAGGPDRSDRAPHD